MKDKNHRITLSLLEKDYQIACPPEEEPALLNAAKELERRMRRTRLQQGVVGAERIAVLVALNLCYELQQLQNTQATPDTQSLQLILEKVEHALQAKSSDAV
jgi:cell division protein ZapA